jgi:hypothetical protein
MACNQCRYAITGLGFNRPASADARRPLPTGTRASTHVAVASHRESSPEFSEPGSTTTQHSCRLAPPARTARCHSTSACGWGKTSCHHTPVAAAASNTHRHNIDDAQVRASFACDWRNCAPACKPHSTACVQTHVQWRARQAQYLPAPWLLLATKAHTAQPAQPRVQAHQVWKADRRSAAVCKPGCWGKEAQGSLKA